MRGVLVAALLFLLLLVGMGWLILTRPGDRPGAPSPNVEDPDARTAPGDLADGSPMVARAADQGVSRSPVPVASAMEVTVVHEDAPVVGASVWTMSSARSDGSAPVPGWKEAPAGQTDDSGVISLPDVTLPLTIVAWGSTFAPGAAFVTTPDGVPPTDPDRAQGSARVVLPPGYVVRGRVKLDDKGAPTRALVSVRASMEAGDLVGLAPLERAARVVASATTRPDEGGWFTVSGMPAGRVVVDVEAAGYSSDRFVYDIVTQDDEYRYVLYRGVAEVFGQVLDDASGAPIAGARAWIGIGDVPFQHVVTHEAFSDVDGRFSFSGVRVRSPGASPGYLGAAAHERSAGFVDLKDLTFGERREVTIRLAAGCSLEGRVVTDDGRGLDAPTSASDAAANDAAASDAATSDAAANDDPGSDDAARALVGASVTIFDGAGREVAFERTGTDGGLAWASAAPSTRYTVAVGAPNHVSANFGVGCGDGAVELALRPYGTIRGRVLSADGVPGVAGSVRLLWVYADGREAVDRTVTVDPATGAFLFEAVRPLDGPYQLTALVDGFAPSVRTDVVVDPPATDRVEHDVRLDRGVPLRGVAVDRATGNPVPGVTVRLMDFISAGGRARTRPLSREAETNEAGVFELGGLHPGDSTYGVVIDQAPYAKVVTRVRVPERASTAEVRVELVRGATLRYSVVDVDGTILRDFEAYLEGTGRDHRTEVITDGIALFERVEPGACDVSIGVYRHPEGPLNGAVLRRAISLSPGESREVEFHLGAGARIDGQIVGDAVDAGRTFAVFVLGGDGGVYEGWRLADAGGHFLFAGLSPGRKEIRVESSDGHSLRRFGMNLMLDLEEGRTHSVEFVLPSISVDVEVVDASGAPVPDAWVALSSVDRPRDPHATNPLGARSGVDGVARMAGIEGGSYTCSAEAAGYGYEEVPFAVPDASEEPVSTRMTLFPEATLRVRLSARSGGSATNAEVWLVRADLRGGATRFTADPPDLLGWRVISGLAAATYRLEVNADGYFPHGVAVQTRSAESLDVEVGLRRLGALRVRLRGLAGEALRGQAFVLTDDETGAFARDWLSAGFIATASGRLETDDQGEVVVTGLPEGEFTLSALGQTRSVQIEPGVTEEVVVQRLP